MDGFENKGEKVKKKDCDLLIEALKHRNDVHTRRCHFGHGHRNQQETFNGPIGLTERHHLDLRGQEY